MNHYGWLIYNGGLKGPKYEALNKLYQESAFRLGISLDLVANHEVTPFLQTDGPSITFSPLYQKPDFILFLDKDVRLAKHLEHQGFRLFNTSTVIANCDDKILTFEHLSGNGIKLPKTLFSPMFFPGAGPTDVAPFLTLRIEETLGYPLIIKEAFGSFGAQVYLIHNRKELVAKQKELLYIPHLYQEYIASSHGRDVRLYVVGGKVVASMRRYSDTDFRANISHGAHMAPFIPPENFKALALRVTALLGADFTGVDLLWGKEEEPILCEVNSNAHIKNILDCTGINVADFIFRHILETLSHE